MRSRRTLLEFIDDAATKNSAKQFRQGVSNFLECMYSIPKRKSRDDIATLELEDLSIRYLSEDRDHASDLLQYFKYLHQDKYAPLTIKRWMSVVSSWFVWNDIIIPPSKMKLIKNKMPKARPITKREENLTPEMIQRVVHLMSTPMATIVLTLMSSGIRIGECISLVVEDIDFESSPVEIHIREEYTKTKTARYTFLSTEAAAAIKSWLLIKDEWVIRGAKYGVTIGIVKKTHDNRIFPFSVSNINRAFRVYLNKAGLLSRDPRTNRSNISPHLFRAYFISQLKLAGITPDIAELLAGHEGPYHGAYQKYTKDQVREAYLRYEYAVSLSSPINLKEMQDAKERVDTMTSAYVNQQKELDYLKYQVEKMQSEIMQGQKVIDVYKDKKII